MNNSVSKRLVKDFKSIRTKFSLSSIARIVIHHIIGKLVNFVLRDSKYKIIVSVFEKVQFLTPVFPSIIIYYIALGYFKMGKTEESYRLLEKNLKRNPYGEYSAALQAYNLIHLGDVDGSLELLDSTFRATGSEIVLGRLLEINLELKLFKKAHKYYEELTSRDLKTVQSCISKGVYELHQKEYSAAMESFKSVIKKQYNNKQAAINLIRVLIAMGKTHEAEKS